jgi:hypothetical protein
MSLCIEIISKAVSCKMYRVGGQALSRIVGDRTRKRWPLMALEPHRFCYPGWCPKPVRLEETPNPRLASESIITGANKSKLFNQVFIINVDSLDVIKKSSLPLFREFKLKTLNNHSIIHCNKLLRSFPQNSNLSL